MSKQYVSEDEVIEAIQRFRNDGHEPTVRAIRKALGDRGSNTTIQKYLDRYLALEKMSPVGLSDSDALRLSSHVMREMAQCFVDAFALREAERDDLLKSQLAASDLEVRDLAIQLDEHAERLHAKDAEMTVIVQQHRDAVKEKQALIDENDRMRAELEESVDSRTGLEERNRALELRCAEVVATAQRDERAVEELRGHLVRAQEEVSQARIGGEALKLRVRELEDHLRVLRMRRRR